jgi:hypothetical protein
MNLSAEDIQVDREGDGSVSFQIRNDGKGPTMLRFKRLKIDTYSLQM